MRETLQVREEKASRWTFSFTARWLMPLLAAAVFFIVGYGDDFSPFA